MFPVTYNRGTSGMIPSGDPFGLGGGYFDPSNPAYMNSVAPQPQAQPAPWQYADKQLAPQQQAQPAQPEMPNYGGWQSGLADLIAMLGGFNAGPPAGMQMQMPALDMSGFGQSAYPNFQLPSLSDMLGGVQMPQFPQSTTVSSGVGSMPAAPPPQWRAPSGVEGVGQAGGFAANARPEQGLAALAAYYPGRAGLSNAYDQGNAQSLSGWLSLAELFKNLAAQSQLQPMQTGYGLLGGLGRAMT